MKTPEIARSAFGKLLRTWRRKRRFSQLAFAHLAGVSSRHLSFLETGRASPSRQMVLRLGRHLDMPRPETNAALLAAGFSPLYLARDATDADLAPLRAAIDAMLQGHAPFPGLVLDRHWNIVQVNPAARLFLQRAGFSPSANLLEALAARPPARSSIENWQEVAGLALERLRTEIRETGEDERLAELERNLAAAYALHCPSPRFNRAQAVIPTRFRIRGRKIAVFSTITQFGTVQDLALADLRVELMFPMDERSREYFEGGQELGC